jgi:hypothetical protein
MLLVALFRLPLQSFDKVITLSRPTTMNSMLLLPKMPLVPWLRPA